jgi:hypothetical protein
MQIKLMKPKAQSILEYVVLIAVTGAVLGAMGLYFRRSIQAVIKYAADQVGDQKDAEEIDPEKGTLSDSDLVTARTAHVMQYRSPNPDGPGWVDGEATNTHTEITGTSVYKQKQEEDN